MLVDNDFSPQKVKNRDLLAEICFEDLPSRRLIEILERFSESLLSSFSKAGLSFTESTSSYATSRRFAVLVKALPERTADSFQERLGPPLKNSILPNGQPNRVGLNFAQSCKLRFDDLKISSKNGQERLLACFKVSGRSTVELLPGMISDAWEALENFQFMSWGKRGEEHSFIRPVRSILLLFGPETIKTDIRGIKTLEEPKTLIDFHSTPNKWIMIPQPTLYEEALKRESIIVDFRKRRDLIVDQLLRNSQTLENFDDLAFMNENPVFLEGELPENLNFLAEIPRSILEMVFLRELKVLPGDSPFKFSFLVDKRLKKGAYEKVIKSYGRAIGAVISNIEHFYKADSEISFQEYQSRLNELNFHEKVGTYRKKKANVISLALYLKDQARLYNDDSSRVIFDEITFEMIQKGFFLLKYDLSTDMVTEFPYLHGIVGSWYTKFYSEVGKEDRIIFEKYQNYLGKSKEFIIGDCEKGDFQKWSFLAAIIVISDALDSMIGLFSAGVEPTGTKDPYGIRQLAKLIIYVSITEHVSFDSEKVIDFAIDRFNYPKDRNRFKERIKRYLLKRFTHLAYKDGSRISYFTPKILNAVQSSTTSLNFLQYYWKIVFLQDYTDRNKAETQEIRQVFKRLGNINGRFDTKLHNPEKFVIAMEDDERRIFTEVKRSADILESSERDGKYKIFLASLVDLCHKFEDFFAQNMINSSDQERRRIRKAIINYALGVLLKFSDFSQL